MESTEIPKVCATCEHFRFDPGYPETPGYSSWTPGSPAEPSSIYCGKKHWEIEGYNETEKSYRDKQLAALNCPDYQLVDLGRG
jgi:hypothetical protein